jgi:hypothetical protein
VAGLGGKPATKMMVVKKFSSVIMIVTTYFEIIISLLSKNESRLSDHLSVCVSPTNFNPIASVVLKLLRFKVSGEPC